MRYFLKIKQNGHQVGVRRVQAKTNIQTTDELLLLIKLAIKTDQSNFIVRIVNDQIKFRIVRGWKLEQYFIKSGLQLEVQLLSTAKQTTSEKQESNGHLGELLFNKQSMGKIIEEDENQEQEEKTCQISHLVIKKYQQLLRHIQKNNTEIYIEQMKANHPQLGPCQNQYYKKQLKLIQNQLGARGWAAIHYAVFAGNLDIVNYLIEIGIDINTKSSDQWLPIQLAVRQQNYSLIDILVAQPLLNINICTAHGLVLNMAVQSMNMLIVTKLLMKDVNFTARDHLGRTVFDVLGPTPDKQMLELLSRQQRRQSITVMMAQKNVVYHTLISSFRGEAISIKTPPRKDKQYYICLNPYEKSLKIYTQKIHYPTFPKQIIPFNLINKFQILPKSQKSWYMKNDLFYFVVLTPKNKHIFGCHFQPTVYRWIDSFKQCRENINMYPDSIGDFERNDTVIMDRVQKQISDSQKKITNNHKKQDLISLFTSKCTQKTQQTNSKTPQNKKIKPAQQKQKQKMIPNVAKPKLQIASPQNTKKCVDQNSEQITNKNSLKFSDFKISKVLGEGSFGIVLLVTDLRNPQKKKQYALKSFKKKKLVINKQIKYTITEINILKQLCHPFIVNLHFTFQTPNYVYLGLDYCPNKDLSYHIMNQITFPQKQAMIYAAQILLALEYLHQKNIIYRDLKPENIMLDQQGHIKLVDFGLSKQGQDRDFVAKSFCGSPAYLSPQMLVKKGVGKQSDFYCLGAVLYEMIVGQPPYFSDDVVTLYNNISTSKLTFPKSISAEAKSLLTGLLERNPKKRLGFRGPQQIKEHIFFKDINWTALMKRSIKAPIRQQVQLEQEDDRFAIQIVHQDFDYSPQNYRVNRFINFSFIRQESSPSP